MNTQELTKESLLANKLNNLSFTSYEELKGYMNEQNTQFTIVHKDVSFQGNRLCVDSFYLNIYEGGILSTILFTREGEKFYVYSVQHA
jgi:hypothetical protein